LADLGRQLREARDSAVGRLDEHLKNIHAAQRLSEATIRARFGRFHAGWAVPLNYSNESFDLNLLITDSFPFEPPQCRFSNSSLF